MKLIFTCIFIAISAITFAQPSFYWERTSDTASIPTAQSILTDNAGNIYTCGNHDSWTNSYIKIAKYDQYGNPLWETIDTGSIEGIIMFKAKLGGDGNIYVTGSIVSTTNREDVFLSKYDSSGNKIWMQLLNSPADSSAYSRSLMYFNSHIYTVGYLLDYQSKNQAFIEKYDTNGTLVWSIVDSFNNAGADIAVDIANDGNNIIITGFSNQQNILNASFLLVKYNQSGSKIWQVVTDFSPFVFDTGRDIAVDSDQSIYVASGNSYYDLVKYNSNGVFQWFNTASPFFGMEPASYLEVKVDSSDNIYLIGTAGIAGGIDGYPAFLFTRIDKNGVIKFNYPGTDIGSAYDFDFRSPNDIVVLGVTDNQGPQILNFDSIGNITWNILYRNDVPNSSCHHLVVDKMKNVIIAGEFYKSFQTIKYGNLMFTDVPLISSKTNELELSVFPNPTSNTLTVKTQSNDTYGLRLVSMSGITVFAKEATLNEEEINISNIPSGIYFLQIRWSGREEVVKVVKM